MQITNIKKYLTIFLLSLLVVSSQLFVGRFIKKAYAAACTGTTDQDVTFVMSSGTYCSNDLPKALCVFGYEAYSNLSDPTQLTCFTPSKQLVLVSKLPPIQKTNVQILVDANQICPSGQTLTGDATTGNISCITSGSVGAGGTGDPAVNCSGINCDIGSKIRDIINILSGLVGVVVVAMIVVGGIQYSSAGNDPAKITAAKKRILNAIIALVTFVFLFAFLQWIVPGGIFA